MFSVTSRVKDSKVEGCNILANSKKNYNCLTSRTILRNFYKSTWPPLYDNNEGKNAHAAQSLDFRAVAIIPELLF